MILDQWITESLDEEMLDELMLTYNDEQKRRAGKALLRLATSHGEDSGLVAVCWQRNKPFLDTKTWRDEYIDFVSKSELLQNFKTIEAYDNIALADDWIVERERVSFDSLSYLDALVLGMHPDRVRPVLWSDKNLNAILGAEVPDCVVSGKFGNIAKLFLYRYLENSVRAAESCKGPRASLKEELSTQQMEKYIKDIYIYNKISFYQEMKKIHRELCQKQN